jgi:hypothetical protein
MKKTRKFCISVSLQIKTVFKRQLSNAASAWQTQSSTNTRKDCRYHRTMKYVLKLDNYLAPEKLEAALQKFVNRYNNE